MPANKTDDGHQHAPADAECYENLATKSAAKNTDDGIANCPETELLANSPGDVTANRAADQLNDESRNPNIEDSPWSGIAAAKTDSPVDTGGHWRLARQSARVCPGGPPCWATLNSLLLACLAGRRSPRPHRRPGPDAPVTLAVAVPAHPAVDSDLQTA